MSLFFDEQADEGWTPERDGYSVKEIIGYVVGDYVTYVGACNAQVNYTNSDDPRDYLIEGSKYKVSKIMIQDWYSLTTLEDFPKK